MMFPLAGIFVLPLPTFTPPNISTESHCCGRMTVHAMCPVPFSLSPCDPTHRCIVRLGGIRPPGSYAHNLEPHIIRLLVLIRKATLALLALLMQRTACKT